MDKKLKAKWVKALRSGKYKQGNARLKSEQERYCCLGVLAEIQGCKWNDFFVPVLNGEPVGHENGPVEYLAPKVAGGVRFNTQKVLAELNDGERDGVAERLTFKQLADYIEKKL